MDYHAISCSNNKWFTQWVFAEYASTELDIIILRSPETAVINWSLVSNNEKKEKKGIVL